LFRRANCPVRHSHPGIYVDRLIVGQFEKRIEQRTLRAEESDDVNP
jgi:hypothetical protein